MRRAKFSKIFVDRTDKLSHVETVSKQALGRGLGSLMKGVQAPPGANAPAEPPAPVEIGRGVNSLLKGTRLEPPNAAPIARALSHEKPAGKYVYHLPRWFYFAADGALCLLAAWVVSQSAGPLTTIQLSLCGLIIAAGAVASLVPILAEKEVLEQNLQEEKLPKWILADNDDPNQEKRRFVIHLHQPFFVGEVVEGKRGSESVRPLWISNSAQLTTQELDHIVREAGQFYHWQTVRAQGKSATDAASDDKIVAIQRG